LTLKARSGVPALVFLESLGPRLGPNSSISVVAARDVLRDDTAARRSMRNGGAGKVAYIDTEGSFRCATLIFLVAGL
jgi:hypothetical protein